MVNVIHHGHNTKPTNIDGWLIAFPVSSLALVTTTTSFASVSPVIHKGPYNDTKTRGGNWRKRALFSSPRIGWYKLTEEEWRQEYCYYFLCSFINQLYSNVLFIALFSLLLFNFHEPFFSLSNCFVLSHFLCYLLASLSLIRCSCFFLSLSFVHLSLFTLSLSLKYTYILFLYIVTSHASVSWRSTEGDINRGFPL